MHLYGQAMAIVDPIRVRMWAEAELTTGQLRMLVILRQQPGATLGDLARELRVSPPTASGLAERLVRQAYVRREDDAHDRRFVRHHLTDAGLAILSEAQREVSGLFDAILTRLSDDELDTLVRGLTLLSAAAAQAADTEVRA